MNFLRDGGVFEGERLAHDILEKSRVVVTLPRETGLDAVDGVGDVALVVEHEVEDQAQRPDVRLIIVASLNALLDREQLRGKEERSAHQSLEFVAAVHFGGPEVSDLDSVVLDQQVRGLDVPVQDLLVVHELDAPHDLGVELH